MTIKFTQHPECGIGSTGMVSVGFVYIPEFDLYVDADGSVVRGYECEKYSDFDLSREEEDKINNPILAQWNKHI